MYNTRISQPVLLDKSFQCTSATALYLWEIGEKGDVGTLEYHLFGKGYNNSDVEKEFNEFTIDDVSENYASKSEIPVGSRKLLRENTSSKQLAEVNLIDRLSMYIYNRTLSIRFCRDRPEYHRIAWFVRRKSLQLRYGWTKNCVFI